MTIEAQSSDARSRGIWKLHNGTNAQSSTLYRTRSTQARQPSPDQAATATTPTPAPLEVTRTTAWIQGLTRMPKQAGASVHRRSSPCRRMRESAGLNAGPVWPGVAELPALAVQCPITNPYTGVSFFPPSLPWPHMAAHLSSYLGREIERCLPENGTFAPC